MHIYTTPYEMSKSEAYGGRD